MKKETTCRLCSACCPIEAEIENGRLVSAKRKSFLPEAKRLICPKLRAAPEIVHSPDRLKTPLIREGDAFREAGWDEALDLVAGRFLAFKERYGAPSVAWIRGMAADWGAPWDYVNRLMNAFGSPNAIGNGSVCHVAREFAHTWVYGAMTLPEVKSSKCIVVWGKNDRNTSPGAAEGIYHAKANGAKLIVIDPVETALSRSADLFLQIKPGHDGLLAMAMIQEIISGDRHDAAFVDRWTVGFEALKAAAARFPAETVGPRIWLDPEQIRRVARLYAETKPACIVDGNGLDMQLEVFDATRAVAMLRGLAGNVDRPGGDFIPQPAPTADLQLRDRLPAGTIPVTADYPLFDTFHHNWGRHAQSCVVDAILEERPYPLKMAVVQSGNPVVSFTDANRAIRALEKLEFLVVIDPFLNRTGEMADVVLPAATCFEETQLNRSGIRNNPVILQDRVLEPLFDSRPDGWIVFELGRRMGLAEAFPWETAEAAIDAQLAPSGITVRQLRENPDGVRAAPLRHEKYKTDGFATPSGKLEFFSQRLADHGFPPAPFANGHLADPISFGDRKDEFPLVGISGARDNRFTHSQFRMIPSLCRNGYGCTVDLHRADAERYGIADGQVATVETPRGRATLPAKITPTVRPGSVRIAWGWGDWDPEANLNRLTDDDRRNPLTGTPSSRTFRCRLVKT